MPVRTDRTEARARSLSRGSASTSTTSTRSTNSGWAEQRHSRGGLAGRQPGWGVAESVRLEKTVVEQTLRVSKEASFNSIANKLSILDTQVPGDPGQNQEPGQWVRGHFGGGQGQGEDRHQGEGGCYGGGQEAGESSGGRESGLGGQGRTGKGNCGWSKWKVMD